MNPLQRQIRTEIYLHFRETGKPPTHLRLAAESECDIEVLTMSLKALEGEHLVALQPDNNAIWMAHPFSGVPTAYVAQTATNRYDANCAWDVFAIPAILEQDATVSYVPDDGPERITRIRDGAVEHGDWLVHLVVPARQFWDDVGHT